METKKSKKANVDNQRFPILLTAFLFTGGMTLASFTFKASVGENDNSLANVNSADIVFQTAEKEIDKPQDEVKIQVVTPPQEKIVIDSINQTVPDPGIVILDPPKITFKPKVVVIDPPVETFPDQEAMFPGGAAELQKWIGSNVVYPQTAIEMNEQGRVYLSFVVELDGSLSNIKIERGVSEELDREAKRVARNMPKWIPGELKGHKVRTLCRLPIIFELD